MSGDWVPLSVADAVGEGTVAGGAVEPDEDAGAPGLAAGPCAELLPPPPQPATAKAVAEIDAIRHFRRHLTELNRVISLPL